MTLRDHFHALAHFCLLFTPVHIHGQADTADVKAYTDDIDVIERKMKELITAYGDFASDNFGGLDKDYFRQIDNLLTDGFNDLRGHLAHVAEDMREERVA